MQRRWTPTRISSFAVAAPTVPRSFWTRLMCSVGATVLPIIGTLASVQPSMAAGSKQVVYQTKDGHIHELFKTTDGDWGHADLTQLTRAPPTAILGGAGFEPETSPVGYAWDAGASKQVVYWGQDLHVYELYVTRGGSWQHADLTQLTGAPIPNLGKDFPVMWGRLNAYAWETGKSKQVVYLTPDGHVHELYAQSGGSWHHADLTAITRAPPAETNVYSPCHFASGYAWETGKSKQVAYITPNGHIHELFVLLGANWHHDDLTSLSGGDPIDPDRVKHGACRFQGYGWEAGRSKQVAYQDIDDPPKESGNIEEIYTKLDGHWFYAYLGYPTDDYRIFSSAYAWEVGGYKQVVYKDSRDAHIWERYIRVGEGWRFNDLTELTGAPTPSTDQVLGYSWEAGKSKQVVYTTRDGHIHELSVGLDGNWQHKDVMTEVKGDTPPPPANGSLLSAFGWNG
jgi:hypothetical protein